MIKVDRLCAWIFISTFALLVPSFQLLKFTDELTALLLMGVVALDCIVNNNWKKYKGLWIMTGIMAFYAIYSIIFEHYTTSIAILVDMLIQMKPFIPFFVFLVVGTSFSLLKKKLLKIIALANCLIVAIITIFFRESLDHIIQHISYVGITAFVSSLVFIYASIEDDGKIKSSSIFWGFALMSIGLLGTRAKFFASFIIALYFILLYKPGISKQRLLKFSFLILILLAGVGAVSWYKFEYYFITGNSGRFEPDVIEAFARPIMYATGFLILISHIPFGSGLGSFASYASGDINYSSIYYDYGINNIAGLSPRDTSFICDAFYPSLAQFGFAGIILFIYFWIYIAQKLKTLIRYNPSSNRIYYSLGWIIIFFILIESIASTTFVQSGGQCAMMILGGICFLVTEPVRSSHATDNNNKTFSYLNNTIICRNQTPLT